MKNNYSLYTCPMHPGVREQTQGHCPECGMNLICTKEERGESFRGRDKHAGHSIEMFWKKFWVSLALTIPVVLYSDLPARLLGFKAPSFPGSQYLPLILGSVVFFYGGWVFLRGAVRELKARLPGMMTLIGLAIAVAYGYSVATIFFGGMDLFWELTTLITVMLLGHWMEMRSIQGARDALKELSKLLPDTAEVIKGSETNIIPLGELQIGSLILIRPGARVPSDGVVVEGGSQVNEAIVTGESKPVAKKEGSEVIAGTINGDGSLKVKVTKIGEHTFLAGVMRLVAQAQASKSRIQLLADRAAFYLTIIAITTGLGTFAYWLFADTLPFAIERSVAVLVIACPHALGLAIPLVASISTSLAARNGVLVRERLALERARSVDVVLFDKTGTLTKGEYGVTDIMSVTPFPISNFQFPISAEGGVLRRQSKSKTQNSKFKEHVILQLAASVDSHSEHFVAQAVMREAKRRKVELLPVANFKRIGGKGVRGLVKGKEVLVGGEALLRQKKVNIPETLQSNIARFASEGKTVIYVIVDNTLAGAVALADVIRDESHYAVTELKRMGVKVVMITGDSENVARWVAGELGIDEYFASVLPDEKVVKVKLLQQRRLHVAMVGDGVNDAPALTQANIGIAIGAGTNVAIESAGIILVKNDPRDIVKIIKLSRLTYGKMIQNLFWATGYNIIVLPLAAGVLAPYGMFLPPALSALFMSLSTVIVAFNAILLRLKAL